MQISESWKEILNIIIFGIIVILTVVLIVSTGFILILFLIMCMCIYGAYHLWTEYIVYPSLKKEENFDTMKEEKEEEEKK